MYVQLSQTKKTLSSRLKRGEMSHSVPKTKRSRHSVKRGAAAMHHLRNKIYYFENSKHILLGATNNSMNLKINII